MLSAKTIDELYEEVKDYDLVLCNDAPLALALNNRVDRPRIGTFAVTPRQLAGDLCIDILKEPLMSDIEVVRKISKATGYPMRFVHGEIENIKMIRRHTFDVRKYIRKWKSKEIFEEYIRLPTLEKVMDSFNSDDPYFEGKRVAVIGTDLFDSLDKNFNHPSDDEDYIELFKDCREDFSIREFRMLANDHQIAQNAVNLIKDRNPSDFAIVMDVGGKIADNVRSELYREGIPFINSLSIRDLSNIRDYLEFITRSADFSITKSGQVRELIQTYGGIMQKKYDDYLIENYGMITDNQRAIELLSMMKDIGDYTYGQICERVTGKESAQVKLMLTQLNLYDTKINPADTADIIYSVDNFELKHNEQIPPNEKEGVLLVDCKNSVYIDRPVVIYLGLGPEWEKDLSALNHIDPSMKDSEMTANVRKFQILLQQGTTRIYICNKIRNGKKSKPCIYFQKAEEERNSYLTEDEMKGCIYSQFEDIAPCIQGPWHEFQARDVPQSGSQSISCDHRDFEFSSSSFNDYITCPRKFMFGRIVRSPEKEYTLIGTYLHQYAEFRICCPDKARELGKEFFVRYISDRCTPLFSVDVRKLRESKIRSSIDELDDLIDTHRLSDYVNVMTKTRSHENEFFKLAGIEGNGSDCTEVVKASRDRHMNGALDYVKGRFIYDFKTGGAKDAGKIWKQMDLDTENDYGLNYQALFYLSLLEDEGHKDAHFTFFYTTANEMGSVTGTGTPEEGRMVHVMLIGSKDDYVMTRLVSDSGLDYGKYERLKDDWDEFIQIVKDVGYEGIAADYEQYVPAVVSRMGLKTTKKDQDMVSGALKVISKILNTRFYRDRNVIFVTEDELEGFRELVSGAFDEVMGRYETKLPIDPRMKCEKCEYRDMCITDIGGDADA